MEIEIEKILDGAPKREHGDIEDLKQSIQEFGLLNPITLNHEFKLLAGRRRFQAVNELGWKKVPVRIINTSMMAGICFDYNSLKNKCEICDYPFADEHHILPKRFGGSDEKKNRIFLCSNHHRAIHFLLQLELWIGDPKKYGPPENHKAIQLFIILNDQLVYQYFQDYLKERMLNEANKTRLNRTENSD